MSQIEQNLRSKQNIPEIRCYRSPKIEIRASGPKGRGLFATEKIKRGEVVAIKAGHIVTADRLPEITTATGDYALQIDDYFYLSPISSEEVERLTIFINHSCDPNVGFDGQITYVAMRDIEPEEELCHDYAMMRTDGYSLDCLCGSELCRGKVTGEDWKDPQLQQRYGNYFSSYILRKIRQLRETEGKQFLSQ
ncbi:MAG: SET domain-containing protein-lysine N-methyltransferase [Deltaproteobacteria bacterium]|nr:SET domain-containing protein-lysine N-methyltransferase [Deltaproteobacteria bacterium]